MHRDELTLIAGLLILVISKPWLLPAVVSVVVAGILCAILIRFTYRKESLSIFRTGDL
jgi:hypothetical protein